jgi:menaquinone-dependent protoporphyrinogen oxidase
VHLGKHEREMVRFVRAHHIELEELPTAFLSISLSEAGVEDPNRSEAEHAAAAADVRAMVDDFLTETGWKPARLLPVAGALLYRRYGVVTRFVMRMIARRAGASTDTSCDHVFTDWEALDRLVKEIAAGVELPRGAAAPP